MQEGVGAVVGRGVSKGSQMEHQGGSTLVVWVGKRGWDNPTATQWDVPAEERRDADPSPHGKKGAWTGITQGFGEEIGHRDGLDGKGWTQDLLTHH